MAKRAQRIKNAKMVDRHGNPINMPIKEWKELHPGEVYFDSTLEWYAWKRMGDLGITNLLKPVKIELIPGYDTWTFDFPKNIKTEKSQQLKIIKQRVEAQDLSKESKGKLLTKWKGELTREFNKLYNKELVPERSIRATWEPDFLLPTHHTFLETKGGQGNDAWRNTLKMGRWLAYKAGYNVVVAHTQAEVDLLLTYLIKYGIKSTRDNYVVDQNLELEINKIIFEKL
jgi:hypothetical protein